LSESVTQSLEDRVAVSFSGGLDSTLIAHVAKNSADTGLYCAGTPDSEDMLVARKISGEMKLPMKCAIFEEKTVLETYGKCYSIVKGDLLKVELLVPVYAIAEIAKKDGQKVMLFGTAAEELFAGYERYYLYLEEGKDVETILREEFKNLEKREIAWIKKICKKFDIEARFPFYSKEIAELMFSVPLEERMADRELKKPILREAAKLMGVPETAVKRRKKAMQYGSGIHKIIMKNTVELNLSYPFNGF